MITIVTYQFGSNFDEDKGHPRRRWVCRLTWNRSPAHRILRGATCSGKTTLAKHLNRILPDSVIIHQDVRISTIRLPLPMLTSCPGLCPCM